MKKEYFKPAMQVVKLQHRQHILTVSNNKLSVKRVNNSEELKWDSDGFAEGDEDY
jgi:hypothetical protein